MGEGGGGMGGGLLFTVLISVRDWSRGLASLVAPATFTEIVNSSLPCPPSSCLLGQDGRAKWVVDLNNYWVPSRDLFFWRNV